jgi:hypothetical protein
MNGNQQTITLTKREHMSLIGKAKQGWRAFFNLREYYYDELEIARNSARIVVQRINSPSESVDIEFLKSQYLQLYQQVNKMFECPVCLEEYENKEAVDVLHCGHMLCKGCKEKIADKKCPTCRKVFH